MITQSFNNKLVIITAPSGAGKTSIVKQLLLSGLPLSFSISACTRSKREGEEHAVDYYFLTIEEFKDKVSNQEFIEYEEVYPGSFYGTLRSELIRIWNENKAVLFDIDVQGALNLKGKFKEDALTIYVKAPSKDVLTERLKNRKSETSESLMRRIEKAHFEMQFEHLFDKIVINDELNRAVNETKNLISAFLKSPTNTKADGTSN